MILNIFTSGYSPEADILLIAVRTHTGEFRCWTSLDEFLKYFLSTDDKIVIGFNILKWDIPLLLLKARETMEFTQFFKKINYCNVVDLFTVLTFQNQGVIKGLDFYLQQQGIEREFLTDPDIIRNLDREKTKNDIKKKLEAIDSLYWKLKKQ